MANLQIEQSPFAGLLLPLRHNLIVSCQARDDEPLNDPYILAQLAKSAVLGGAKAIRANKPENIRAIRKAVDVPIFGIYKKDYPDSPVYITPTVDDAREIVEAGCDVLTVQMTDQPRPNGESLADFFQALRREFDLPIMADVSTLQEALAAAELGADIIATTMAGYTPYSRQLAGPDFQLIREITAAVSVPVIAEGRISTPNDVRQAFATGAYAVVVGTMITRPHVITAHFAEAAKEVQGGDQYQAAVRVILDEVAAQEGESIGAAATAITEAIQAGGTLYLLGTGHSHMLAEEAHFRAGGLASVVPILPAGLMLHESAGASTLMERTPGLAAAVLDRYPLRANDCLIVFSNSGVNAVPVEAAMLAKERGLTVIAVQSKDYAVQLTPRVHGKKLGDLADIVIDNHLPPGDTLVSLTGTPLTTGAGSTVVGAFILNTILAEVIDRLVRSAGTAPIYISANLPGAMEHNQRLIKENRARNPHL